ncbi:MAG: ATP-binding protein [Bacteroidetes bacterium]|nr:MAG: ATP-binding protein [Bacteroidota bacterium]
MWGTQTTVGSITKKTLNSLLINNYDMQPYLQQALDALHHAQYAQVFEILQEAKAMDIPLYALQKEYINGKTDADFAERLKLAIKDAIKALPIPSHLAYLPAPSLQFVGREAELQTLHANLQAGKRTALVNGLGGVGKTALAQKYAQNYQNDYAHILYIRQSGHLLASFIQREIFDNLHLDLTVCLAYCVACGLYLAV